MKSTKPVSPYPVAERGLEVCITITKRRIKLYGNKAAFRTIAKWMEWIADSKESEHFSFSVLWNLSRLPLKRRNVFILVDKETMRLFGKGKSLLRNFEITFMAVEKSDLKRLRRYEKSGLLPPDWEKEPT
jgi:hypothetical protein